MGHNLLTAAILGGLILGVQTAFPGASVATPDTPDVPESVSEAEAKLPKPGQSEKSVKSVSTETPNRSGALVLEEAPGSSGARQSSGSVQAVTALANALSFGGHSWLVKSSVGIVGPGPNRFAVKNATVDSAGNLHLRVTKDKGKWYSSEIINTASLGYGTYRWTATTDLSNLDRNVVLGLFTWNDLPDYANREIDIEIARWGSATDPTNAQFVVQPYNNPGHLRRYAHPAGGPSTLEFTWAPGRIDYVIRQGAVVVDSWSYVAPDVPVPGGETVRMNLWQYQGLAPANGQPVELVFSNFDYCTPAGVCQ